MTPERSKTVEKMKSVMAEWNAALKHYQDAEKARTSRKKAATKNERAAARQRLA